MDELLFESNSSETTDLCKLVETIPGRLYLAVYSTCRRHTDTANLHFFNADIHANRRVTWEIPDLGRLTEYIRRVNDKIYDRRYESKVIVHYTYDGWETYSDAAVLVGAYSIAVKEMCPRTVHAKLKINKHRIDENSIFGFGNNYNDGLYDCLSIIYKAVKYKLVNFNDFSCKKYYGCRDLTWIVPDKFIAFRGPVEEFHRRGQYDDLQYYVEYFQKNNVKTVIRLNCADYNSFWFTNANIKHVDLYFKDGSTPSMEILRTFLNISEQTSDVIAVHCKAGLGRTGTLIAAYLIQHYRMTAREAVAWIRICRPGSIMNLQQSYLMNNENILWKNGDALRKAKYGNVAKITYCDRGIYSTNSRRIIGSQKNDWNDVKYCNLLYNKSVLYKNVCQES